LAPGNAVGGVRLVLQGSHQIAGGSVLLDNALSDNLGPWGLMFQGQLNQALKQGEQIYAQYGTSARSDEMFLPTAPRRLAAAGLTLPLGVNGLSLNVEFTQSTSLPRPQTGLVETRSDFERYSARLSYPYWLQHERTLILTASMDATDQRTSAPLFNVEFDHDVLRTFRAGADLQLELQDKGRLQSSWILSQGVNDLGARSQDEAARSGVALSRPGMNPAFSKLEGSLAWELPFHSGWVSRSSIKGQVALNGVLPGSELFSLDGEDALSAFRSGAISDDGGVVIRQQMSRPFGTTLGGRDLAITPYIYVATGSVQTQQGSPKAPGWNGAWGGGIKMQWQNVGLQFEGGRACATLDALSESHLSIKVRLSF
jgi:hemolysin activation/secretion protein